MVNVTRVFVHTYDEEAARNVLSRIQEKMNEVKVYKSRVVPNYIFVELEGSSGEVVKELLRELGVEDFKVVEVKL